MAQNGFFRSISIPVRLVLLMWIVKIFEVSLSVNLQFLGIFPRTPFGMIGIITSPLVHHDYFHLLSNSIPLLVLGSMVYFFYSKIAPVIFYYCYIATGFFVWLFARGGSFHIGASGFIYGIAFFLLFIGIFRKDFLSVVISLLVAFFYGGMIWGVFPSHPGISWESHLIGACVGVSCASYFGRKRNIA